MTCNDIITSHLCMHTLYTTFTVMREGERVHTFLGLAGMEWGTATAVDWSVPPNSGEEVMIQPCVFVCLLFQRDKENHNNSLLQSGSSTRTIYTTNSHKSPERGQ